MTIKSKTSKKMKKHSNSKSLVKKGSRRGEKGRKRTGPRLPISMRKELDRLNPNNSMNSDEDIDSDEGNNFYEYEEEVPQEESRKNRRFDPVENYEYELPEQFEDENVPSDDEEDDADVDGRRRGSDQLSDGDEEEDDGRHTRMLQGITGMPTEAFEGKKKKNNFVMSEAYPESEYNPTRDILEGGGRISIQDLLDPLQGMPGYSKLKKRIGNLEKTSTLVQAPLPNAERERLERIVSYEQTKKEVTKWQDLVKRNREAPTLYLNEKVDVGYSTVGAIASEFEPRTEFEKKIASLVHDDKVMEAHKTDGSKILELNEISIEDYMKERNHIAKMRSLLFHHELKKKRIKNIKSKAYHRLMKKDKMKVASAEMLMDPEAAKEQARKQEFKRAEERMTLKHKNKSKWARRILERGLNNQDEGTREAMAEQLRQHALLTRKMSTMKDSSSSDSSSDEDDEDTAGSDEDKAAKFLAKAKEKTLKVLEDDDEVPSSGVLSLPFMVRGLKKRKEEAMEEAKLALEEYEKLEIKDAGGNSKVGTKNSGRMVFGVPTNKAPDLDTKNRRDDDRTDNFYDDSDNEDGIEAKENFDAGSDRKSDAAKDVGSISFHKDTETRKDSVFKNFDDIVQDPGPKTTYEVAIFASETRKKMKTGNGMDSKAQVPEPVKHNQDLENLEEVGEESDSDSEGQMVDGILSSGPKESYELPSQAELIRQAFAGDDVEEEFEKDKEEILDEENPEPEKPVLLPGWGQWTHVQKKRGLPSWMLKEHNDAKQKREEALKKRKDAQLKHVIISEKVDKKAEKLLTKTLPYPYTSKEAFEQGMRMPIGPEFNPATVVGPLNRPEVVNKAGVIIKPIEFKEVNPHEKSDNNDRSGQKQKRKKSNGAAGGKKKKQ